MKVLKNILLSPLEGCRGGLFYQAAIFLGTFIPVDTPMALPRGCSLIEDQVIVELKAKLHPIKCTIPVNIIDNQSG